MMVDKERLTRIGKLSVIGVASLLSVMAVSGLAWQLKGQGEVPAWLELYEAADKQDEPSKPEDKNKKKEKSAQEIQADKIAKRHIFSIEKPKGLSLKLMGILGDVVYFQGENKGFELGQSHKGAKIKQIGPDWVELEFEGKDKKLYVFTADKGGGPSRTSGPGGKGPAAGRSGPLGAGGRRGRGPRGMGQGFELTPEMIERFKSMPPEMRQRILERMPAEMREKIEKEL